MLIPNLPMGKVAIYSELYVTTTENKPPSSCRIEVFNKMVVESELTEN
jgi:hypothetical protein